MRNCICELLKVAHRESLALPNQRNEADVREFDVMRVGISDFSDCLNEGQFLRGQASSIEQLQYARSSIKLAGRQQTHLWEPCIESPFPQYRYCMDARAGRLWSAMRR
jgi:hypothetical protein